MKLAHQDHPDAQLRTPSEDEPLRILVSGCLAGWGCGVDGTDNGVAQTITDILNSPRVDIGRFCPEEHTLGVPRGTPDIHGGDGSSVLDGEARVKDEHGVDVTDEMIEGARAMLKYAVDHRTELCILTDMSGACGTQVISEGSRFAEDRRYQVGMGVAAALLHREGFAVVSQRDFRTLGFLRERLSLSSVSNPDGELHDHHETTWYRESFGDGRAENT